MGYLRVVLGLILTGDIGIGMLCLHSVHSVLRCFLIMPGILWTSSKEQASGEFKILFLFHLLFSLSLLSKPVSLVLPWRRVCCISQFLFAKIAIEQVPPSQRWFWNIQCTRLFRFEQQIAADNLVDAIESAIAERLT